MTDKTKKINNKKTNAKADTDSIKNTPHDSLVKKVMENPIAAQEFLDQFLPVDFKNNLNLSTVQVEKETFVEKNLKKQLSDIVLSVQTKNNKKAFIYTLIESQSSPDYWISFRLWKYMLLLCERHKQKKNKLPLICPLVLYHGSRAYDAPLNFWELFNDAPLAKSLMSHNYQLVDLYAMSDDKINYDKHLSIILYMLKHAHRRDKLKLVEDIFKNCNKAVLIDAEMDYVYTRLMLWYNDCKVLLEKKEEFEQLILDNLPKDDGERLMKTIADGYIEEGVNKGILIGEARGEARGIQKGATNKVIEIARRMLQEKTDIKFISSVTGLSIDDILKLQNKS